MKANTIILQNDSFQQLLERISNWHKLKRIVATMLLWKENGKHIDITLLLKAELVIIKFVQKKEFSSNYELQDAVSKRDRYHNSTHLSMRKVSFVLVEESAILC